MMEAPLVCNRMGKSGLNEELDIVGEESNGTVAGRHELPRPLAGRTRGKHLAAGDAIKIQIHSLLPPVPCPFLHTVLH